MPGLYLAGLLSVLFCAPQSHGATVSFQGQTYTVTTVALGGSVPVAGTSDLILVSQNNTKLLMLPTDGTLRGDFDPGTTAAPVQRFYVLNRTSGQIEAFASLDGTLINLDGTFFSTTTQSPAIGSTPLETISRPLIIPSTAVGTDVAIVDSQTLAYRTDGLAAADSALFLITRVVGSTAQQQFTLPLRNADPINGNVSVFVAFDALNGSYLLSQLSLDPSLNADTSHRLTSFKSDGTTTTISTLVLDNNSAFPNFSGAPVGISVDRSNGTIYLLDATNRQFYVIAPLLPSLTSISPSSGSKAGGTTVTISGVNLPLDSAVAFGGVAATNVSVSAAANAITATTPAHAPGAVDVTVTGTGISGTLTLAGAFTYVDQPPVANLAATPTTTLASQLTVTFTTAGSMDPDGTLTSRELDFGDGVSFTFPPDLKVVTTIHTYTDPGTYTATLTVRDDQNLADSTSVTIIIGSAGLTLRSLSFSVSADSPAKGVRTKDSLQMKGEIVMPQGTDLDGAQLVVGFVNPDADMRKPLLTDPPAQNALQKAALQQLSPDPGAPAQFIGGEYTGEMKGNKFQSGTMKFQIKPLIKPGFPPDTQSFSFSIENAPPPPDPALQTTLREALKGAGVTLLTADEIKAGSTQPSVARVLMVMRIETAAGQALQYTKLAVIDVRASKKNTAISLKRR
jgi:PKD repeat protein